VLSRVTRNGRASAAVVVLAVVAGCGPDEPRCVASVDAAKAPESCDPCASDAGLCATAPRALDVAYRVGPPVAAAGPNGWAAAWHSMRADDTPPSIRLARFDAGSSVAAAVGELTGRHGELYPHLAAGPDAFGVTWSAAPPNDAGGEPSGVVAVVPTSGADGGPHVLSLPVAAGGALAWSGERFGILWSDRKVLTLTRADATGERVEDDVVVRATWDTGLAVAWNGESFALAWGDGGTPAEASDTENVYLLEAPSSGPPTGEPLALTAELERPNPLAIEVHALEWTGTDYVLLWSEGNDLFEEALYLGRVPRGSAALSAISLVSTALGAHWHPALAQHGSGFAVAYQELRGDHRTSMLVTYDASLVVARPRLKVSSPRALGDSGSTGAALTTDGTTLRMLWSSTGEKGVGCPGAEAALLLSEIRICE
jgi:hypothetical protein